MAGPVLAIHVFCQAKQGVDVQPAGYAKASPSFAIRPPRSIGEGGYEAARGALAERSALHFDNHVIVLDVHGKGLGHVGSLLQVCAAFDRNGIGTDLEPLRVEP